MSEPHADTLLSTGAEPAPVAEITPWSLDEMIQVWQRVLPAVNVDADTNFFRSGGDSLAGLNLLTELERKTGRRFEFGTLFQYPVLQDFIEAVIQEKARHPVSLRHFYCVQDSPASIPVFCFGHVPNLGEQQSVYFHPGIYERIHATEHPLTIDEILHLRDELLEEILAVCPNGPYRLSGYCHGGWMAFAISQQLFEVGKTTDFLNLIEVFPRVSWYRPWWRQLFGTWGIEHPVFRIAGSLASRLFGNALRRPRHRGIPVVGRCAATLTHFASVHAYRRFEKQVFDLGTGSEVQLVVQRGLLLDNGWPQLMRSWDRAATHGWNLHPVIEGDHHSVRKVETQNVIARRMLEVLQTRQVQQCPSADAECQLYDPKGVLPAIADVHPFFAAALANSALRFHDVRTGRTCSLSDLVIPYLEFRREVKELAFVYQNNSLDSVGACLGLLASGWTLVLLRSTLDGGSKECLERLYNPVLIYDPSRPDVPGYEPSPSAVRPTVHLCERFGGTHRIAKKLDLMLTTSGSTGSPKFVKLSLDNLLANARSITQYLPIRSDDVTPLNLPLDYSYGLSILTSHCLAGGTLMMSLPNVTDPQFWSEFRRFRMTSLAGTPDFYRLIRQVGFLEWSLPSLRYMTQAGGSLDPDLVHEFANYSRRNTSQFFVMYGQTEATARMSYLPPEMAETHAGTIGYAIPGGRFEIDAASGELCYAGQNVFGGYVTCPKDLESFESPDLLRTGDLAVIDRDGVFRITGRIKRIVKVLGARVSLDEMEAGLREQYSGLRFAVTSRADDRILVAVQGSGAQAEFDQIREQLAQRIGAPRHVIRVAGIAQFPLNANGKLDYPAVVDLLAAKGDV